MSCEPPQLFRVLSVEDNPADVLLLQTAFDESGFACDLTFCQSHQEAQAFFRKGALIYALRFRH